MKEVRDGMWDGPLKRLLVLLTVLLTALVMCVGAAMASKAPSPRVICSNGGCDSGGASPPSQPCGPGNAGQVIYKSGVRWECIAPIGYTAYWWPS